MKGSKDQKIDDALQVSKKRKREKPLIERLPPSDSEYNCKFARALGSVDWQTRDKGLQALTIWLSRNTVSDADLTKIWKALFFCFWHSDKAPVQVQFSDCCMSEVADGCLVTVWCCSLLLSLCSPAGRACSAARRHSPKAE